MFREPQLTEYGIPYLSYLGRDSHRRRVGDPALRSPFGTFTGALIGAPGNPIIHPVSSKSLVFIKLFQIINKKNDRNWGHKVQIGEVMAGSERAWRFITSSFDRWEFVYTVIAVDAVGNKSKNPQWIRVVWAE